MKISDKTDRRDKMKKAILEDDTLTLNEKEEKLINQYLLIGWTAINAILFVSYFIECIKVFFSLAKDFLSHK